ncbi:MAG: hypothetical protein N3G76_02710 [Candidatus Micrarchaeota archaeon]|nr:hypothetical protein [Candidatus Micrarchaeota archaeon]
MMRGFVFMLDAFIALMIVIAFVSSLNQFSRDYSYIQDEALYSYGRGMMDILLNKHVKVEISKTEPKEYQLVPLVHALSTDAGKKEMDGLDKLVPQQYSYRIEYYSSKDEKWMPLYERQRQQGSTAKKSVSVVSTIPVIIKNENYTAPYTYGDFCGMPGGPNRCITPEELYSPDEFGSLEKAFVRVVVEV